MDFIYIIGTRKIFQTTIHSRLKNMNTTFGEIARYIYYKESPGVRTTVLLAKLIEYVFLKYLLFNLIFFNTFLLFFFYFIWKRQKFFLIFF